RPTGRGSSNSIYSGDIPEIFDAVWVTGFKSENYTTQQHNKILHYLNEQGIEVKYVNVVRELPKEHLGSWAKEIVQIKWEDIPPVPRQTLSGGVLGRSVRAAGTYVVLN